MILGALAQAVAQVASVPQAAVSAVANTTGGEGITLTASGIALCYVQRYLKNFSGYQTVIKTIPGADKWGHRVMSGLITLITAVGFSYNLDYDALRGGQLVIALPALAGAIEGAKHFFWIYLFQQYAYDATKQPPAVLVPQPPQKPVMTVPMTTDQTESHP